MTIHHVYACRSNVGDWLSARGIQGLLGPVQEHLCDEAFRDGTLARLAHAGPGDLVVLGGGGLFTDYFREFWQGFLGIADGFPFALWGVGSCDHKDRASLLPRQLLVELAGRSRLCVVRDALTRDLLAEVALPDPVPCPAVLAVEPPAAGGRGVLHVVHRYLIGDDGYERAREAGRAFAASTGRGFGEVNHRIREDDAAGLEEVLRQYGEADVVLTSRLHGAIIGLAMGRKVLAISGDRKIESFMTAAGLGAWVCEPEDADAIRRRLDRIDEQPSVDGFVDRARREHRAIGDRVLAMALRTAESVRSASPVPAEADG